MTGQGLSERHARQVVHMSASSFRYCPAPDRNSVLRERIRTLAFRHRRYGAGMIYLKLRQEGEIVNHKRVDRLYTEERLQLKRPKRKKVPITDRQPLVRPEQPNEVWSMDFVFDRSSDRRVIKTLAIVDDAIHDPVCLRPERAVSGVMVTRILDELRLTHGLPKVIRTDNSKEFCGRAMLTSAHQYNVTLRLIEPAITSQNAFIESFNGRFRDECLNEHWLLNLEHARVITEAWRKECSEERPPKALGGLAPGAYAKQLKPKSVTVTTGLWMEVLLRKGGRRGLPVREQYRLRCYLASQEVNVFGRGL